MEYALEGYGFSAARILRNMLERGSARGGAPLEPQLKDLAQMVERYPGLFGGGIMDRFIEGVLRRSRSGFEPPPGLLSTLTSLGRSGPFHGVAQPVAFAARAVFDLFRRDKQLHLAMCTLEEGPRGDEHMLLGVHARAVSAEVRKDDEVNAGVLIALHREPGGSTYQLEVLPRVFRKVCDNGAIVFLRNGAGRGFDLSPFMSSDKPDALARELEPAVQACFDEKAFEGVVNSFRLSASEHLEPNGRVEAVAQALGARVGAAVLQRYARGGDFTRWGFLNAVTAEARTADSELMLKLERLGGELAVMPMATLAYEPSTLPAPLRKKSAAA